MKKQQGAAVSMQPSTITTYSSTLNHDDSCQRGPVTRKAVSVWIFKPDRFRFGFLGVGCAPLEFGEEFDEKVAGGSREHAAFILNP